MQRERIQRREVLVVSAVMRNSLAAPTARTVCIRRRRRAAACCIERYRGVST